MFCSALQRAALAPWRLAKYNPPMFHAKKKLYVCISLDVEEEGLFSGKYSSRDVSVSNVAHLQELAPISREMGFPLTLYCAYQVFVDSGARRTLAFMRDHCGAEIGAHLHHWSTPPFLENAENAGPPERTHLLSPDLLRERLRNLLKAGRDFQGADPESFRMGRWDLKARLLPLLAEEGIRVDSSICPLRAFKNGPDHFLAPPDPYWLDLPEGKKILEAPITQIPLSGNLARLWRKMALNHPDLLDAFHFFGCLSPNPVWHGAAVMRWAARLHVARGGQVLSLFLHSSELMPGASPNVPDKAAARKLIAKTGRFCAWLKDNFDAQGVRASELPDIVSEKSRVPARGEGDWRL